MVYSHICPPEEGIQNSWKDLTKSGSMSMSQIIFQYDHFVRGLQLRLVIRCYAGHRSQNCTWHLTAITIYSMDIETYKCILGLVTHFDNMD